MTNKTDNLGRVGHVPRKKRLSREARARMASAGRKNIEKWLAEQDTATEAIRAEVASFREQVFAELGARPSATRKTLAETLISTYCAILLVNKQLIRKRPKSVLDLTERVSWLSGTLLRTLKLLNLDARPRPRTLADVFVPKVEQERLNDPQKPSICEGKS